MHIVSQDRWLSPAARAAPMCCQRPARRTHAHCRCRPAGAALYSHRPVSAIYLVCTHCLRYAYTNLISTTQRHSSSASLKPTDQPGAGRDTAKHLCRQFGANRSARPWLLPLSVCSACALHLTGHAATAMHNLRRAKCNEKCPNCATFS